MAFLLICDEVKVGLGRTGFLHSFDVEGVVPDIVSFRQGDRRWPAFVRRGGAGRDPEPQTGLTVNDHGRQPGRRCGRACRAPHHPRQSIDGQRRRAGPTARRWPQADVEQAPAHRRRPWSRPRHRRPIWFEDTSTRVPATKACAKVAYRAAELGAAVSMLVHHSNVLELTPPITLSEAEAEEGLQVLDARSKDVEAGRVSDEAVAAYAGW